MPVGFHLSHLDAIFVRGEATSQALRFLMDIFDYESVRARRDYAPAPQCFVDLKAKAYEVFVLKFLKEEGDPWNVDPSWADAFVDDPSLFAILLYCLIRHERDLSSEQHHYRSIVKKFLKRCMLLHGWGHGGFRGVSTAETFQVIRDANRVEFYRTLFVWEMGGLITALDEVSLKAVELLAFEDGWTGQRPRDLDEAIEPPVGADFSRSIYDLPTCQRSAAKMLIDLRRKVKAEKRDVRIKRQKEREARKQLSQERRQQV